MAIIGVQRMWSKHDCQVQASRVTITEAYQVAHDINTNWSSIYNAIDPATGVKVPIIGDKYNRNGLSLPMVSAKTSSLTQVSVIMSIVTISWEGTDDTVEPTQGVKISWTDTETDEEVSEDFTGKPICTVNGEPIEGVTMKKCDQIVTIERRFEDFNAYSINAYRHSVNSDTFMGYPPGMARLTNYSATFNAPFWDVAASIQFRYPFRTTPAKAWYKRVCNQGYYIKSGSEIKRATDDLLGGPGEPVVKPVLLKTTGAHEPVTANATWLEFQVYGSLPYNALGLI